MVVMIVFLFFFFKQKTAYEMRISDWSSDVCSSDLQPLVNFQGLQWKFAEMKIKAEAAQLLLYRAALGADTGFPSPQDTAIAKIACNRAGFDMANEAMQIMGGTGYSEESLVEYC